MNTLVILIFVIGIFIVQLFHSRALNEIRNSARTLGRIEMKLDLVMQQAGVEFPPYKALPGEVIDALKRGEKIAAIKSYRAATGVGLKEAKDRIEDVQRRAAGN
jgi:hypothetical protein